MAEFLIDWENAKIIAIVGMGLYSGFSLLRNKKTQQPLNLHQQNRHQKELLMKQQKKSKNQCYQQYVQPSIEPQKIFQEEIKRIMLEKLQSMKTRRQSLTKTSTENNENIQQSNRCQQYYSYVQEDESVKIEDSIVSIQRMNQLKREFFIPLKQQKDTQMEIQANINFIERNAQYKRKFLQNQSFIREIGRENQLFAQRRQAQRKQKILLIRQLAERRKKIMNMHSIRKKKQQRQKRKHLLQRRKQEQRKRQKKRRSKIVYILSDIESGSDEQILRTVKKLRKTCIIKKGAKTSYH